MKRVAMRMGAGCESGQRPDAVVYLPEDRQVVIDAKVSNKAWKEWCTATDDALRAQHMRDHVAAIRAHIRRLAERNYARSPDLHSVDFVLMFVPIEGALTQVLAEDDSLYVEAYKNKIILVSPTILMAVLKLVEGIWVVQQRTESAEEIAEAGRKLYEKFTVFSRTFEGVGAAIAVAQASFDTARKQLATGRGNAVALAQRMIGLGVRPSQGKEIAQGLLELSQAENEEADDDVQPSAPSNSEVTNGEEHPPAPAPVIQDPRFASEFSVVEFESGVENTGTACAAISRKLIRRVPGR